MMGARGRVSNSFIQPPPIILIDTQGLEKKIAGNYCRLLLSKSEELFLSHSTAASHSARNISRLLCILTVSIAAIAVTNYN
jgi:hypothetical protein